ncbi:MAG: hypothetical protein HY019_00455 [Aquabacterium sp.]|uniref:DUF6708 domain-containing protein n=1 Tax=Aquabacterium sp. TaxID=1872578 RepID=UPI0025C02D23|nr:DUF6708 domain-containing protein [Aquabacterium sp.]MBI3380449.1 hypothetical protein [Aquabacterium sp.]
MKVSKLLRHGEYLRPAYMPAKGQHQSAAGVSTDQARPDGKLSGTVKRFAKKQPAGKDVLSLGFITAVYKHAVSFIGVGQGIRGYGLAAGLLCFSIGAFATTYEILDGTFSPNADIVAIVLGRFIVVPGSIYFAIVMSLKMWRIEMFCPLDEPTIFDREHRKVYRLFRELPAGWFGQFKPWPMRACEYDWDLIDVEHVAQLGTNGSTVSRRHALMFIVRKNATDPTIIDSFNIGNGLVMNEITTPAVWEHIRRYMEENGPPVPGGEPLAQYEAPQTLWQCMGAVGVFGKGYLTWWKTNPTFTFFSHLAFPLFLPINLVVGFGNWLSRKTAYPVEWPQEVLDAIGQPEQRRDV